MSLAEMTDIVNDMDEQGVEQLLDLVAEVKLTISQPPRTGLMMLTVQDSFGTDFHLGEILVTEARVLLRGTEGFGMVIGEAPRRALAKAAVDALLRCPESTTIIQESLVNLLRRERLRQDQHNQEQAALIAATTVNFDLMAGA